jgi:polysaccharide biosynthesis transport protein
VALLLSTLLGLIALIALDAVDTTFSEPEEVATQLGVDVLASLPMSKQIRSLRKFRDDGLFLPGSTDGKSETSLAHYLEAVRTLRNAISFAAVQSQVRTLLVTSAVPAEGKSTTAAQLASVCARVGKRVLLIDADLRRPSLHRQFGVGSATGLSDLLMSGMNHRYPEAILPIDGSNLHLMPAGPVRPQSADLLDIGFADLLNRVAQDYELTIIDAPPMLGISDAQTVASMVDGVLVVAKAESTPGKALSETLARLLRIRANIMGVVMNQVKPSSGSSHGYYYYHAEPAGRAGSHAQ